MYCGCVPLCRAKSAKPESRCSSQYNNWLAFSRSMADLLYWIRQHALGLFDSSRYSRSQQHYIDAYGVHMAHTRGVTLRYLHHLSLTPWRENLNLRFLSEKSYAVDQFVWSCQPSTSSQYWHSNAHPLDPCSRWFVDVKMKSVPSLPALLYETCNTLLWESSFDDVRTLMYDHWSYSWGCGTVCQPFRMS